MTRRGRLISLLVALMALSGAYATSGRAVVPGRAGASIAWSRSERAQVQVARRGTRHIFASTNSSLTGFPNAAEPPAASNGLPLSRFQRPPPAAINF